MKFIIKFFIMLIILAVGLPFFMNRGEMGDPWQRFKDMFATYAPTKTLPAVSNPLTQPDTGNVEQLYRWRDSNGQLHISDIPPKNITVEEINVNRRANTMQALTKDQIDTSLGWNKKPTEVKTAENKTQEIKQEKPPAELENFSPAMELAKDPVGRVNQLIKDAKNVSDGASQRDKALQGL
ncbi:MAG: DUF4124 domain-containing protein [Pseudomonadota bacterium]